MATIWRPTYKGKDGTKKVSRKWWIDYTDANGKRQHVVGFRDKRATEAKAATLERNAERARAGMPIADDVHRLQPLDETINAYLADLARNGSDTDSRHYKESKRMLLALVDKCRWKTLADIRPDSFTAFLAGLAQQGRAPRTQNRYHETLRAFLNWCTDQQHWLEKSPISGLKLVEQNGKGRRHRRRAYTVQEWQRLIAVAPEPRKTVYLVAGFSGLRRSELVQIQKCDCMPIGDRPRWHIRPEVTKNGQPINLPMSPDCANALLPVWEAASSANTVLLVDKYGRSAVPHIVTLHDDLKAAGINRQDDQGRWADFHSFRYFFCKQMGERLPIQKVKTVMRHSTIKLTADLYGELRMEDVAEEVWTLPTLFPVGYNDPHASNVEQSANRNGQTRGNGGKGTKASTKVMQSGGESEQT